LALWWRMTWIAPEVNAGGGGMSCLEKMMQLIPNQVWQAHKFTPGITQMETENFKHGFYHSNANHEFIVQKLNDVIVNGLWVDPDAEFWSEALNIVRDNRGIVKLNGKDRTAARCILAACDILAPQAEVPNLQYQLNPRDYPIRHTQKNDESSRLTRGIPASRPSSLYSGMRRGKK
jgi:hypothetical protein